jgi:hypothetical protein
MEIYTNGKRLTYAKKTKTLHLNSVFLRNDFRPILNLRTSREIETEDKTAGRIYYRR